MWITIPDKEENNTFSKIKIGELFIDHSNKSESGDEEVYLRTEEIDTDCGNYTINAVNLHSGDLFNFYPDDTVEPIRATLNIKRS